MCNDVSVNVLVQFLSILTNVPLWKELMVMGEVVHVWGRSLGKLCTFLSILPELKSALKNKGY